ncbi:MAG: hypothetical protein KC561_18690, partial [Myxococcales bacterium]|nr:hypothetical protein [Myxococcales bacterium]
MRVEFGVSRFPAAGELRPRRANDSVVLVGSAHKVGSTWLVSLIQSVADYTRWVPREVSEVGVIRLD